MSPRDRRGASADDTRDSALGVVARDEPPVVAFFVPPVGVVDRGPAAGAVAVDDGPGVDRAVGVRRWLVGRAAPPRDGADMHPSAAAVTLRNGAHVGFRTAELRLRPHFDLATPQLQPCACCSSHYCC